MKLNHSFERLQRRLDSHHILDLMHEAGHVLCGHAVGCKILSVGLSAGTVNGRNLRMHTNLILPGNMGVDDFLLQIAGGMAAESEARQRIGNMVPNEASRRADVADLKKELELLGMDHSDIATEREFQRGVELARAYISQEPQMSCLLDLTNQLSGSFLRYRNLAYGTPLRRILAAYEL